MATMTVDSLLLGEAYDRVYLAKLWGYEGHQAIARGVTTPAGQRVIVLFVTRIKQTGYTQYENRFEGDVLHMEGERGDDSNFTFYGEASIVDVNETLDAIHFTLNTHRSDAIASNALATEDEAHGTAPYLPDEEGRSGTRA